MGILVRGKSKRNRKIKVKLDNDASLEDVIGAVNVIDKQLKNMVSVNIMGPVQSYIKPRKPK